MKDLLTSLIALSPPAERPVNALLRQTCAQTVGLMPLPFQSPGGAAPENAEVVAEVAEQFSTDVSALTDQQRGAFLALFGAKAFHVAALMFIADFVPRVRAGLAALEMPGFADPDEWDTEGDPVDLLVNRFTGTVGALRELDPLTTEIVRLRGAVAHNCRLCKSLREGAALEAGGSEDLYSQIELFETSSLLDERQKAALRYVDALLWAPAHITAEIAAGMRAHYSEAEATEITLDVMRNAINKIAVALGGDAPRVAEGTEVYRLGLDGMPVYA